MTDDLDRWLAERPRVWLSSSWAGAGRVIEAMVARGFSYVMWHRFEQHGATFNDRKLSYGSKMAATAPEAIALAAKAALESEDA